MKKTPPDIATLLELSERPSDIEYDHVGTTGGVIGTWHRLWAAICVQKAKVFGSSPEAMSMADEAVTAVRHEFESKFGRPLSPEEFDRLELFAEEHSANLPRIV